MDMSCCHLLVLDRGETRMGRGDILNSEVITLIRQHRKLQGKSKMRDVSNKENNTGEEVRPGVETVLTGSDAAELGP